MVDGLDGSEDQFLVEEKAGGDTFLGAAERPAKINAGQTEKGM